MKGFPFPRSRTLLATLVIGSLATTVAGATHRNAIPPRLQWEANGGYCGEVSLISAGLFFGQYLSQFDARRCAIGRTPQNQGELLLGINDQLAAERMRLAHIEWEGGAATPQETFLGWVKRHVVAGRPVVIGVFNNERRLYGRTNPDAGDPTYDHIVPVVGVKSADLRGPARPGDRLIFSDNGLWGRPGRYPFLFTSGFGRFPADRATANEPGGPVYSLPAGQRNFGIAITGVADDDGVTRPVRVWTSRNAENPAMRDGSSRRPPARPLTLTVQVSGLQPGVDYRLYRYAHVGAIPTARFNALAGRAVQSWDIRLASGSTWTMTQTIRSDETAAYRCVPVTAP